MKGDYPRFKDIYSEGELVCIPVKMPIKTGELAPLAKR
jgi:hypothetical protein